MHQKRTIVIGDCHGHRATLLELLVSLRLERGPDTTILFTGDVVDRGPDSKGVLDLIMWVQREQFNVVVVRGNHEQLLLDAASTGVHEDLLAFTENGGTETLRSFGVTHPSQIPSVYLDFIAKTPLYWQNERFICTHASLPCDIDEPISAAHRHEIMWKRTTWTDPAFLKGKRLVTGHQIKSLREIRESLATQHIFVDNGCYLGSGYQRGVKGKLVAVELENSRLWVQANID